MKTINLYRLLLLLLIITFVGACKNDETESLNFYNDSYEVPIHGTRYIGIKSGSGDYSIQVKNTGIFSASEEYGWSNSAGMILISGLLTGEGTLTVIDNVTKETRNLKIKVTHNYEVFRVSTFENSHPVLSKTPFLFLINNKARDVYFVDKSGQQTITDNGLRVQGKGTYTFTVENGKTYLTLIYATDNNKQLTNNAAIAPAPHKIQITKNSEYVLHRLDENLSLNWETPAGSYPIDQQFLAMKMEEVDTGYKIDGSLEYVEIPQDILN
ncbi:hypothetical protein [uncultured Bacteroides sp.]|uniref:hypothetical protein n=1 Tax=uncultured Bacteroides sp. TaxID=162156 RepID=UPI002AAB72E2|nr:hypothetical protein [uncultured Bacteroides sp.]